MTVHQVMTHPVISFTQRLLLFTSRLVLKLSGTGYEVQEQQNSRDPFQTQTSLLASKTVKVIFDIGAHKGDLVKRYRYLFPDAHIYAFEAYKPSWISLQARFVEDRLVSTYNQAISDRNGHARLNVNSSVLTNSLLETHTLGADYWQTGLLETKGEAEVETITIDSFCKQQSIAQVDILKLDIQGAELLALQGAKEMLCKQAIDLIYCEVILVPTYEQQSNFHELLTFMHNFDYELWGIYNLEYQGLRLNQIDVIFCSRKFDSTRQQALSTVAKFNGQVA